MTNLTRRSFALAGLGATSVLGLHASAIPAVAAPQKPATPPAMFGASLGNYQFTAIFDGMVPLGKSLFSGPDQAEIDDALTAAGISGDALPAPVNAFLLQSNDRTILIDAGLGEVPGFGPGLGRLTTGLAAAGVAPEDVDLIIATHAHPDHIGGLVAGNAAVFPHAEIVICDIDHGFWSDAGIMAQAPKEAQGMFGLAQHVFATYGNRLRLAAPGTEVAPGLTLELSPGHTPGHSVVHVDGGDRQLLMVADTVLNTELQTALPKAMSRFDTDPEQAAKSRAKIFDRAATDNILIAASHVHFPSFGRFVANGSAYRFVPASWI